VACVVVFDPTTRGRSDVFRLQLKNYEVVVFKHVEETVNWLSTCRANLIDVAALVITSKDKSPLFSQMIMTGVPTFFVGFSEQEKTEIETSLEGLAHTALCFCRREQFIDDLSKVIG